MDKLREMFEIAEKTQEKRTGSLLHNKTDIEAFVYLKNKFPRIEDIITATKRGQIWLDVELEELEQLTQEDVNYLNDCGVFLDDDGDILSMVKAKA